VSKVKKSAFNCIGIILAGGQATRMQGKNKALQKYNGKFLFQHAYDAMSANIDTVLVNVNLHQSVFLEENIGVFKDEAHFSNCGPLSGLATALSLFSEDYSHVLFSPCDTPLVPDDVFGQLVRHAHAHPSKAFYIETGAGAQPLHVIMPVVFLKNLLVCLEREQYRVMAFYREINAEPVFWSAEDSFININYLDQLL
jgi:molybdenum cofactor guanylyltransferase